MKTLKKLKNNDFTAYHAPAGEEIIKSGFETEELAWKYVESQCMDCCEDKPCEARMCEWFVMPTEEFNEAENFGDIMKAAGFIETKPLK